MKTPILLVMLCLSLTLFGQNWEATGWKDQFPAFVTASADGSIYMSGQDYTGNDLTGLYRSTDNGANFTKCGMSGYTGTLAFALQSTGKGTIFFSDRNSKYLYDLYRSTDKGENFSKIEVNAPGRIQYMGEADGKLYLAAGATIFESDDDGASLTLITATAPDQKNAASLVVHKGKWWTGSYNSGLYYSEDKGRTWTQAISDGPWGNVTTKMTGVTPDGVLYANAAAMAYKSTDDGATWTEVKPGIIGLGKDFLMAANGDVFFLQFFGKVTASISGADFVEVTDGITGSSAVGIDESSDGGIYVSVENTLYRYTGERGDGATTSIAQIEETSSIFPNPVNRGEMLRISGKYSDVQIMDLNGRTYYNGKAGNISTAELNPGLYLIELRENDRHSYATLIVK